MQNKKLLTNEDYTMLSIPVYENPDEAITYFGWTENISRFTKRTTEFSWPMKSPKIAAVNKLRRRDLISNGDQLLSKYAAPLSMQCKFNPLRSGQFGVTDPFIQSLFSKADFSQDKSQSDLISDGELEKYLQRLDERELNAASNDLDHYFCDGDQSRPVYDVEIPGELILSLDAEVMSTTDDGSSAPIAYPSSAATHATIVPFSKTNRSSPESPLGDLLDDYPRYEFPGKNGRSRRLPTFEKQVVFASAYKSSRLDYMHI